jgi:hypothetical protein
VVEERRHAFETLSDGFPQTAQTAVEMLIIQNSQNANLFVSRPLEATLRAP